MNEVKGPLLIFKCLLNWCHGTPSLHLPTLANVERANIQERRSSEGGKKSDCTSDTSACLFIKYLVNLMMISCTTVAVSALF